MRAINPLREILDAAILHDEVLLDTEWPADDNVLLLQQIRGEHPASPALAAAPALRPRP